MDKQFVRGARAAAALAGGYETSHPYKLEDCILMKLNVTRRKRARKNRGVDDQWLRGCGLALAEVSRLLGHPIGIETVLRNCGVTLAMLKRAGLDPYDLDELRRCL